MSAPELDLQLVLTVNADSTGGNMAAGVVGDIVSGLVVDGCPNDPYGGILDPATTVVDPRCASLPPGVFQVRLSESESVPLVTFSYYYSC